jgi:hypothetical protein
MIVVILSVINLGLIGYLTWKEYRDIKRIEARITELERRMQNCEVELFSSVAHAVMPDGKMQNRITLHGVVHAMYKKVMGIKEPSGPAGKIERQPLIIVPK